MLQVIIITSLFCNGLHLVTRQGQLLFALRTFVEDVLFIRSGLNQTTATFIYKPVLGCITCMASVWGFAISLALLPFSLQLLYQIPVICVSAAALNMVVFALYE